MDATQRIEIAETVANRISQCDELRSTARVWAKSRHVRVYVRMDGRDIGYISVDADGELEANISRRKGSVMSAARGER